jgi:hypothetical protein
MKEEPEQYGMLPDGRTPGDIADPSAAARCSWRARRESRSRVEFTPRQALRTRAFWFIGLRATRWRCWWSLQ